MWNGIKAAVVIILQKRRHSCERGHIFFLLERCTLNCHSSCDVLSQEASCWKCLITKSIWKGEVQTNRDHVDLNWKAHRPNRVHIFVRTDGGIRLVLVALVTGSFLLLVVMPLLLVAMPLLLVACFKFSDWPRRGNECIIVINQYLLVWPSRPDRYTVVKRIITSQETKIALTPQDPSASSDCGSRLGWVEWARWQS